MTDDENGYVRRPEFERQMDRLETRLKVHIADAKADAKDADTKADRALAVVSRAAWMLGGGTGLLVGMWTIYNIAVQVWATLSKIN